MNRIAAIVLGAALFASGCAGATDQEPTPTNLESITQAETDLAMAKEKHSVWMLIDKSTGKKAAPLPKLLDAAKKAEEAGDIEEANRIAARVSAFAKLGTEQAESQPDPRPFFN